MFDGLRKLLGLVGAAPAQRQGMRASGAVQKAMSQLPQALPAMAKMQPMAPMSQDNQMTNQMVGQGQLPQWQVESYPQFGPRAIQQPRGTYGSQEDVRRGRLNEGIGMPYGDYTVQPWDSQQFKPRDYRY